MKKAAKNDGIAYGSSGVAYGCQGVAYNRDGIAYGRREGVAYGVAY